MSHYRRLKICIRSCCQANEVDSVHPVTQIMAECDSAELFTSEIEEMELKVKNFLLYGCGCSHGINGSPCSRQFSEALILENLRNCMKLSHGELDLVILANIQAFTYVEVSGEKRKRSHRSAFTFQARPICKEMFLRLYGISYSRFRRLKDHYEDNGISLRVHGNHRRLPPNATSQTVNEEVKNFLTNYALDDDEQKLSAKDIEWSDLNISVTGGHTKGLGNHEERKSTRVGTEDSKKSKKGKRQLTPSKEEGFVDKTRVEPVVTSPAEDPCEEFLKGQGKRQAVWNAQRAAIRAKVVHTPIENQEMLQGETVTASIPHCLQRDKSPPGFHGDEIRQLEKKLEEKSRTCELLEEKLAILQQQKRQAAERDLHENFYKMVDKVESIIQSTDRRVCERLDRIEDRLNRLGGSSVPAAPIAVELQSDIKQTEWENAPSITVTNDTNLKTIDIEALSRMQDHFPVSPNEPVEPKEPVVPDEPLLSLSTVSTPMPEDLVRSCVAPQKVQRVRETLHNERDRIKCATKLLPEFFTTNEMAVSNTEGNYGKQPLDKKKLHTLKVLIFSQFPVGPDEDESKCWRIIKCKINAKCRAKRFECAAREGRDN